MAITGKGAKLNAWAFRTSQWGRQAPQLPRKRLQFGETDNTEATVWKDWFFAAGGSFPTQFSGVKVRKTSSTIDLCLVAEADAAPGMGGVPKINKNGTIYALYLVETSDPNASPVRIQTSTGVKAIRLKT